MLNSQQPPGVKEGERISVIKTESTEHQYQHKQLQMGVKTQDTSPQSSGSSDWTDVSSPRRRAGCEGPWQSAVFLAEVKTHMLYMFVLHELQFYIHCALDLNSICNYNRGFAAPPQLICLSTCWKPRFPLSWFICNLLFIYVHYNYFQLCVHV